ncbi:MAG: His/Gly/Thr/Pro-type tRNA ligase C-terminal domain-containing protein, partial [Anaerovoracaceae bacterium]
GLIEQLGGPPIPGVGFGLGIERLLLTMEAIGIEIEEPRKADAFIAFMGQEAKYAGLKIKQDLIQKGYKIEMDDLERNFKGQFKYADRIGAKLTFVLGEDELNRGVVTVKKMDSSEQYEIEIGKIEEELSK